MDNALPYANQAGTNHKRWYSTARWKAIRKRHLNEQPLCVMCEQMGKLTPADVVDHIIPHRGDHDLFFEGKLQSLCKLHHDHNKQMEEKSGVIVGGTSEGMPIDPNHHWNLG